MSKRVLLGIAAAWGLMTAAAQTERTPAPLPLRNVVIEMRQDDGSQGDKVQAEGAVGVRVQDVSVDVRVQGAVQQRQWEQRGSSRQQVLVLNGRSAALAFGNQVPVVLYQLVVRNGVQRLVPGALWLQAGASLQATPMWEGGDRVYLELASPQARTTLVLPVDTWTTIAESDAQRDDRGTLGSHAQSQTQVRLQVRVGLR